MKFIDRVSIIVESGAGGDGCVSFRREKYVPRGGPDGGNGGRGGDVVFRTDSNLSTLLDYRYKNKYKAGDGARGKGSNMTGKDGEPVILRVPPGTQIIDARTQELLADLMEGEFTAAQGGKGGRGNASFATSTRQAPRTNRPGQPGQTLELVLELKLIADVGIFGMPNAGKSTLISRISAARPKVADYPFTTLTPNLGVVRVDDRRSFVVADVPGLIEGAHRGTGLGHQFLRHIERTSLILHLVALGPQDEDPVLAFRMIRDELARYGEGLARRQFLVVLGKVDLLPDEERGRIVDAFLKDTGVSPILISAVTGEGLKALVESLASALARGGEGDR